MYGAASASLRGAAPLPIVAAICFGIRLAQRSYPKILKSLSRMASHGSFVSTLLNRSVFLRRSSVLHKSAFSVLCTIFSLFFSSLLHIFLVSLFASIFSPSFFVRVLVVLISTSVHFGVLRDQPNPENPLSARGGFLKRVFSRCQ